ncbi:hypothetical protein PV04_06943 [Phialophora macrospora]|uniref:Uncharacterized protein n=1 Tax=Phialophora macrospora TaxID=1851006 RepID=A0A0D2CRC5_9EURO|nr:hypothetical protein PV04_06943 [Phialophora macrospora]
MVLSTRRRLKAEEEDSDILSLDPKMIDESEMMLIQRSELGATRALDIKYGNEMGTRRRALSIQPSRQCDRQGTKEAEIASQNQLRMDGWNKFHTTVDASDLSANEARNLHGHRARTRDQLREEAFRLGLKSVDQLSLDHIDDHPGGGRHSGNKPTGIRVKPPQAYSSPKFPFELILIICQALVAPHSQNARSKSTCPFQGNPEIKVRWARTRSTMAADSPSIWKMPGIAGGGQVAAEATYTKPPSTSVRQPLSFVLSEPSDFMSVVKGSSSQKAEQSNNQQPPPNINGRHDAPPSSPHDAAQENVHPNIPEPSIRRIPVEEFSFPAAAALAPGEVATHTDGAPTPVTLSGFSVSSGIHEQASVQIESPSKDLIGLGIGNVDFLEEPTTLEVHQSLEAPAQVVTLSPTGSIMDSPILDDVKSEVLAAQSGGVVEIAGRQYVPLDEFLALREAVERQLKTTVAANVPAIDTPEKPTESVIAPSVRPTAAPSTTSSSTSMTAIPTRPVNPFCPREPLTDDHANITLNTVPRAGVERDIPAVKVTKVPTVARPKPFSSNETIKSKWDTEPSAQPARSAPFSSKSTIKSKWSDDPPPAPQPIIPVRTVSPIIGDRKVFGADAPEYDPPPPQGPEKRKFHEPGPGFYALMRDYANMNLSTGNEEL